jgi:hypothetical protein
MLATKQQMDIINTDRWPPMTGTIYIVESDRNHEFWNWCEVRGVEIQFQGRLYDRPIFKIMHDPSPEFTLLKWG